MPMGKRCILAVGISLSLFLPSVTADHDPVAVEDGGFEEYLQQFGKRYDDDEHAKRRLLFQTSLAEVVAQNARPGALWTAGLTEMSDWTAEEVKQRRLGYNKRLAREAPGGSPSALETSELPASVDWRTRTPPVLTPVKNQGGCGSCWAFAATEAMEANVALNTGKLMQLSPQQITSCTPNPQKCGGVGGCSGATPQLAFNYTIAMGLSEERTYPYKSGGSGSTGSCRDGQVPRTARIMGYRQLPNNDAGALMQAVASAGPVAVSVDASKWFLYLSGVFDRCNKTNPDMNHAVLLVGYGQQQKPVTADYWIVRNSWGPEWAEAGFIRLRRYSSEPCGTDSTPLDGSGCAGGPSEVKACGECGILSDSAFPIGGMVIDSSSWLV